MDLAEFMRSVQPVNLKEVIKKYTYREKVFNKSNSVKTNIETADRYLEPYSDNPYLYADDKGKDFKKWKRMRNLLSTLWENPILQQESPNLGLIIQEAKDLLPDGLVKRLDEERDSIKKQFPLYESENTINALTDSTGANIILRAAIENVIMNELNKKMSDMFGKYKRTRPTSAAQNVVSTAQNVVRSLTTSIRSRPSSPSSPSPSSPSIRPTSAKFSPSTTPPTATLPSPPRAIFQSPLRQSIRSDSDGFSFVESPRSRPLSSFIQEDDYMQPTPSPVYASSPVPSTLVAHDDEDEEEDNEEEPSEGGKRRRISRKRRSKRKSSKKVKKLKRYSRKSSNSKRKRTSKGKSKGKNKGNGKRKGKKSSVKRKRSRH